MTLIIELRNPKSKVEGYDTPDCEDEGFSEVIQYELAL